LNCEKKLIKPIRIFKKPNRTQAEKNRAKPKQPSQTEKQKKLSQTKTGRFEPVYVIKKPNRNRSV
jgi:hypothetical protein